MGVSATERLDNYMESFEAKDYTVGILNALQPTILASLVVVYIDQKKLNHWFTSIYFFGIIIGNLLNSVPMIQRIIGPFSIFGIIVFSWIFVKDRKLSLQSNRIFKYVCVVCLLYFTQDYIKQNLYSRIDLKSPSRMHPYQYVWEDYSNHPSIKYFK